MGAHGDVGKIRGIPGDKGRVPIGNPGSGGQRHGVKRYHSAEVDVSHDGMRLSLGKKPWADKNQSEKQERWWSELHWIHF